jgi:integrase
MTELSAGPQAETSFAAILTEEGRALYHAIEREGRSNGRISSHCNISRMTTVALAMFGGMSAGEMAGLQWEDINFLEVDNGPWIRVAHSLCRHVGLKQPKASSRRRYIPMSQEMNRWLTETAKRDGYPGTGFMLKPEPGNRNRNWTTDEGNHLLRSMTAQFKAAQVRLGFVKENGKARWTMHEMRHYAGSVWLAMGARIEDVSRLLGHAKIATTQKYYINHILKQNLESDRKLMVKMSELHRLSSGQMQHALPKPMRDLCEIDGEAIDLE